MTNLNSLALPRPVDDANDANLTEYIDIVYDSRWLVFLIIVLAVSLGTTYALFSRPIFESNLLIQVEDSEKSAGSFLGDAASSLFDVKTPSAGEIEILRSRMILGQAVENTKLYINASPKYIPLVGRWLARRAKSLSEPGLFGYGGFVSGTEHILVPQFNVPADLEATQFTVIAGPSGTFTLNHPKFTHPLAGKVDLPMVSYVESVGKIELLISEMQSKPGAAFTLFRYSKQLTLSALQEEIRVQEKGKQSGVLDVSWQSAEADKLPQLLNEIGKLYVRQNIDRKAAEAEKTLGFLNTQLPEFKRQLEKSEEIYNNYRNAKGTVSLDDEAKNALIKTSDLQSKLLEAQQRKRDLLSRFTEKHPSVITVDSQIAAFNNELNAVNTNIRRLPLLQQDTVRMQRDIKVNTDLYQALLNSSLQMNLAKEGKVGNVRLLDEAVMPEEPVKPKKAFIIALAVIFGSFVGVITALVRASFFGGIRSPAEIEDHTGLNVYSTIPLSNYQQQIDREVQKKTPGTHILFVSQPEDPSVESLRSLRTSLQFAMLEAPNNRILISGATPGVGKSFVSVNLAAILAASGKRVILIDADLRKGYIHQVFSLVRAGGLSEIISGARNLEDSIASNILPNLDLITTGVLPPNPAELLMSASFEVILSKLSSLYDLVIIDTPPVLVASDTAAVAPHAGTLLFVARAGKTQLGEMNESVKRLAQVGSSVSGVILNALDTSRRHYGRYSYKYGSYRYKDYKYTTGASS